MKSIVYLFTICTIIFHGCDSKKTHQNNIERIIVSPENTISLNYDEFISESEIIPLQKKPGLMLGTVNKIYIKNDNVYIVSSGKIFIFSKKNGQLLSHIDKKGKGPGEYKTIDDIYIEKELIYILDRLKRAIVIYDQKGNYKGEIDIGIIGYAFTKVDHGCFVIYINSDKNDQSDCRLNFYSLDKNKIQERYFKISDSEYNWQYFIDIRNFISLDKKTLFHYSPNNTIYKLEKFGIEPEYIIDFGNHSLPKAFLERDYNDVMEFSMKATTKNYIYQIIGLQATMDAFYFAYRFNGEFIHCIYSLKTKKLISFNEFQNFLHVKGLREGTSYYNLPLTSDNKFFYALVEPNLIRGKLKENKDLCPDFVLPILNSKENENPFLLKFKATNLH